MVVYIAAGSGCSACKEKEGRFGAGDGGIRCSRQLGC